MEKDILEDFFTVIGILLVTTIFFIGTCLGVLYYFTIPALWEMLQDFCSKHALKGLCITFVVVLGSLAWYILQGS